MQAQVIRGVGWNVIKRVTNLQVEECVRGHMASLAGELQKILQHVTDELATEVNREQQHLILMQDQARPFNGLNCSPLDPKPPAPRLGGAAWHMPFVAGLQTWCPAFCEVLLTGMCTLQRDQPIEVAWVHALLSCRYDCHPCTGKMASVQCCL